MTSINRRMIAVGDCQKVSLDTVVFSGGRKERGVRQRENQLPNERSWTVALVLLVFLLRPCSFPATFAEKPTPPFLPAFFPIKIFVLLFF